MQNIFTKHPAEIGESYFHHMGFALGFAANLFLCALACFIHAFCPFLFLKTGSKMIEKMATNLRKENRKSGF